MVVGEQPTKTPRTPTMPHIATTAMVPLMICEILWARVKIFWMRIRIEHFDRASPMKSMIRLAKND
jgi:hypothetical protein